MNKDITKQCKTCGENFKPWNTIQKYCNWKCEIVDKGTKTKDFTKVCANEDCKKEFKPHSTLQKYCSGICTPKTSKTAGKRKYGKINKVSKKQAKLNSAYTMVRKAFLLMPENKYCAVYPDRLATEIHHKMGRVGTAPDSDVPLIIDPRYFLSVSREGHREIEENPEWAKEMGYSVSRLAK